VADWKDGEGDNDWSMNRAAAAAAGGRDKI
ncbi:hypothetical protein A2U01_0118877, partial [Trifolium medium]|nr:hypothetical protein [Trifolium medium]